MRIGRVEPRLDEHRMRLVLGEDDGLAEPITTFDLESVGHQMRDDEIDGVGVEEPLVDLRGIDAVGDLLFAPFQHVPAVFLFIAEIVVAQAGAHDLQRHGNRLGRHQMAIGHRLVERIGVGRDAILKVDSE